MIEELKEKLKQISDCLARGEASEKASELTVVLGRCNEIVNELAEPADHAFVVGELEELKEACRKVCAAGVKEEVVKEEV